MHRMAKDQRKRPMVLIGTSTWGAASYLPAPTSPRPNSQLRLGLAVGRTRARLAPLWPVTVWRRGKSFDAASWRRMELAQQVLKGEGDSDVLRSVSPLRPSRRYRDDAHDVRTDAVGGTDQTTGPDRGRGRPSTLSWASHGRPGAPVARATPPRGANLASPTAPRGLQSQRRPFDDAFDPRSTGTPCT